MGKVKLFLFLLIIAAILTYSYTDFFQQNGITANAIKDAMIKKDAKTIEEQNLLPEIYFTNKTDITPILLNLINSSSDIKCALYDIDYPPLVNAFKEKNAKIAVEDDNYENEFHTNKSNGKMHNKFCIFDNKTIITGATNLNDEGIYKNDNNFIVLHSKYLAENYLAEFDEIYNDRFASGEKVKYSEIILNNKTRIQNYFCPEDECQKHVLSELEKSKSSIYFMTFSFTDKKIADKLIEKNNLKLDVKGVVEKQRWKDPNEVGKYLNDSGVEIIQDKNKYVMHHKVFIIDNKTVITGSYNPTTSGNRYNDENIIIFDDVELAKEFLKEFERLTS